MSLQFQEISRGEVLWVSTLSLKDDGGYFVTYTPAIVQHATHIEVCVKHGNIQPFSTDWLYGFFSPERYEEDPSFFPTTIRIEGELRFSVKHDKVQPIAKKHALHRSPEKSVLSPYQRVNFQCDYGDFEPTKNGFVNAAWAIEKERLFPRFTKPALRQFVENFFIEDMDGTYITGGYPVLFEDGLIYREMDGKYNYENPSSRESILRFFFQRCVPYLANKNWFELVLATDTNSFNYQDSWRDLHRAYVVADQENVEAMSFLVDHSSLRYMQTILDGLRILPIDINLFNEPQSKKIVIQIKTETMRDRLARV